jgi:hypothetical protein
MKFFTYVGIVRFVEMHNMILLNLCTEKELWNVIDWRSIYRHMWE